MPSQNRRPSASRARKPAPRARRSASSRQNRSSPQQDINLNQSRRSPYGARAQSLSPEQRRQYVLEGRRDNRYRDEDFRPNFQDQLLNPRDGYRRLEDSYQNRERPYSQDEDRYLNDRLNPFFFYDDEEGAEFELSDEDFGDDDYTDFDRQENRFDDRYQLRFRGNDRILRQPREYAERYYRY